ncbi:MAG: AAA family ATPase [Peptococcaceae bacterium]|nr:AAA family ATPase [Peptococcaceae bacterium]
MNDGRTRNNGLAQNNDPARGNGLTQSGLSGSNGPIQNDIITRLVPLPGAEAVDWDTILQSELQPYLRKMSETPQNPQWHGEGTVWNHTRMVCESLIRGQAWQDLERHKQEEVFIAALLHDIGKTLCTRFEDGIPVSPHHTSVGERMTRKIMWTDFGLSGGYEARRFRETVCALIRYHSIPFYFFRNPEPERVVARIAAHGALAADFSNELLGILVEADIRGRSAKEDEHQSEEPARLDHLDFFREISKEAGCFSQSIMFPSAFSRYAYLSGRHVVLGQELYDDTWGTVVVLSGLPGTGKDSYLKRVYSDWPVVSLDALRREMGVSPEESQGSVVRAAYELAKGYLRGRQPFVWNATNVTLALRRNIIDVLMRYNAAVHIVFLETSWETLLLRNRSRRERVPEKVIEDLLGKMVPPNLGEAHEVEWVLV